MTEMEMVNRYTRREMQEDEVFLFDVVLCDNDIDRDLEAFSEQALCALKELLPGRTGLFDHAPSAKGQTARLFDTAIVRDAARKTRDGRPYTALHGRAYMVRTDSNADMIREIEGGIKKEVSIACACGSRRCSVCGGQQCSHVSGRIYGDKLCFRVLDEVHDAYEWSFVAVPAQRAAGVTKQYCRKEAGMMDQDREALLEEVEKQMRSEVLALCGQQGSVAKALTLAAEKMELTELMELRQALREAHSHASGVQLCGECREEALGEYRQRMQ